MLNNPFCYTPRPEIVEEAARLVAHIDSTPELSSLFKEGKMLGILETEDGSFLYGFSGLAGGRSIIEGFVPPIYNYNPADIISSSHEESIQLQRSLFENYIVVNGQGEKKSVLDIFADKGIVPPAGTGDCAAPKLLQYAFLKGLKPIAMGEFWYGKSPAREIRRSGSFYPSCTGKCGPLLSWMLQGIDVEPNPLESDNLWNLLEPVILFEDTNLIVVEKPAGMLAVPGRNSRVSLLEWISSKCQCDIFSCHRLDMDTSGVMVFAKDKQCQAILQRQFENRTIIKKYVARLGGTSKRVGDKGKIILPIMPDWYDRPRQCVDTDGGKPSVTLYEILKVNSEDDVSDVLLTPLTGRTHQLRVHAAHQKGLGMAIIGDRLYGGRTAPRLMLHASTLSFTHPVTNERLSFDSVKRSF